MRKALAMGMLSTVSLLLAPALNAAQGNDELWEITTKMDMPGMPMQMADQVTQSCLPKGKPGEQATVTDSSCEVAESKQNGNKTTFKMVCGDTTMAGETVYSGDSFKTTMRMTRNGRQQMTQTMTGKRIGRCDAAESRRQMEAQLGANKAFAADMEAQQRQVTAGQCNGMVKELDRASLMQMRQICGDRTRELCQRVAEIEREPKTYLRFVEDDSRRSNWEENARACNRDPSAVQQGVCKQLVAKQDWDRVVKHCKAEAKANANEICAGRGYSSIERDSELAELCSGYAKDELQADTRHGNSNSAKSNDLLSDEGTRKLKKLLGF